MMGERCGASDWLPSIKDTFDECALERLEPGIRFFSLFGLRPSVSLVGDCLKMPKNPWLAGEEVASEGDRPPRG